MDVYNHVSEMSRIESEITRLESVAISWRQKYKIGVKMVSNQEKVMIIRKKKCCKPRKIKVCKKISKNSTRLLTMQIINYKVKS